MTPEAMARIHRNCFTVPRPWTSAEFAALLAGTGVFMIAETQGFAIGRVIADEAEVLTLAVDPVARRRGIGRRLLAELMRESRARGAATIFLEVAETNAAALALYNAAGFTLSGRRKGYFRQSEGAAIDALVLSRRTVPHS